MLEPKKESRVNSSDEQVMQERIPLESNATRLEVPPSSSNVMKEEDSPLKVGGEEQVMQERILKSDLTDLQESSLPGKSTLFMNAGPMEICLAVMVTRERAEGRETTRIGGR